MRMLRILIALDLKRDDGVYAVVVALTSWQSKRASMFASKAFMGECGTNTRAKDGASVGSGCIEDKDGARTAMEAWSNLQIQVDQTMLS